MAVALKRWTMVLAAALALCGCETVDSVFTTKDRDRIPGERIPVIAAENKLQLDAVATNEPVKLPPPYVNESWEQPGGFANNVLHHLSASGDLHVIWGAEAGAGSSSDARLISTPIIAAGRVYVLDAEAHVRAFAADTGALLWEVDLTPEDEDSEVGFGGGAAFDAGRLYVSTGFGFMVALSADSGQEIWRHKATVPFRAAPTVNGGRVFISTQENQLLVLSAETGAMIWDHRGIAETAGMLRSTSPAVAGDLVVVPYTSGELFGLRVQNGRQVWSDTLSPASTSNALAGLTDIAGRPAIDRGIVIAISHSGRLVGIDTRTGERIWTRDIAGTQTPWVAGDVVYVVSTGAQLICLNRTDGRIRWVTQLPRWVDEEEKDEPVEWSGPVLASDRLLVASSKGEMMSVSPYTGQMLGKIEIPAGVFIAPVIANNTLYVLTDEGQLMALR